MSMVVIVHPTLEDYYTRVGGMATKYHKDSWMGLSSEEMDSEDQFEYSFIMSAVGDQLIQREFLEMSRDLPELNENCKTPTEPGTLPGSVVFSGGNIGRPSVCRFN